MSEYGHKLKFNNEGLGKCPESGEIYKLEKNKVHKL
jgi:UDP-2-acetamido-3-amino-2,3-dideoxy-glucuronate N-acetyltransferase